MPSQAGQANVACALASGSVGAGTGRSRGRLGQCDVWGADETKGSERGERYPPSPHCPRHCVQVYACHWQLTTSLVFGSAMVWGSSDRTHLCRQHVTRKTSSRLLCATSPRKKLPCAKGRRASTRGGRRRRSSRMCTARRRLRPQRHRRSWRRRRRRRRRPSAVAPGAGAGTRGAG